MTDHSTKARLLALKAELEAHDEISHEALKVVELDQQSVGRLSRMDAMQAQAMAEEQKRRRRLDIERIQAALRRIEDDEYGYCLDCGEEIAEKRLEIDPMAVLCIRCATLSEKK